MARGGVKTGLTCAHNDDFGYKIAEVSVSVNDLPATILRLLGLDHEHPNYFHSGRDESLTDAEVTGARVVDEFLAQGDCVPGCEDR